MDIPKQCFMTEPREIHPFVPEETPHEVPVTDDLYKKLFPKKEGIDVDKLRLSNIGTYSISRPAMAERIVKRIRKDLPSTSTVTDAFGNMGGMTISLASEFDSVNVSEIVPLHCEILKNNLEQYGVASNVNLVCGDYLKTMETFEQDAIMFDPPWGGTDYKEIKNLPLSINNVNIICIINRLMKRSKFIYMLVPPNYNFADLKLLHKSISVKREKLEPRKEKDSKLLLIFSKAKGGNHTTRRRRKFATST
jgi:predicted RNA methylase